MSKKEEKKSTEQIEEKIEEKEVGEDKPAEKNCLTFKNKQLDFLISILNFPAHGDVLRARNRFLKIVRPKMIEMSNERITYLEEIAPKDEKGNLKKKMDPMLKQEVYDLDSESTEKYKDWFDKYMEEDYIIDILPSNKADIAAVKEMIKKTIDTRDFDLEQGEVCDGICEVFGINN